MANVLIGNIRGPQGETGPENNILSQVYQFCESESGDKIPEGPWLEELPEIRKGMYIWCRNISTWEHGDDSYLYSVGYVGLDGEFNGIDAVNALGKRVEALETRTTPVDKGGTGSTTIDGAQAKLGITALKDALENAKAELNKRIDGINDYTTGINLILGSMDFRKGIIPNENYAARLDGFFYQGSWSLAEDDEGFTVATVVGKSSYVSLLNSASISCTPGKTYTCFVDFYTDNLSALTDGNVFNLIAFGSDGKEVATANYSPFTLNYLKEHVTNGKWIQLKFEYTPSETRGITKFLLRLRLSGVGTVSFRKIGVYEGAINNCIYAPNLNDINYTNRFTTAPNLLRGTRDFALGYTPYGTADGLMLDGFSNSVISNYRSVHKDSDGFSYLHYDGKANGAMYAFTSVLLPEQVNGDTLTISFDFMVESGATSSQNLIQLMVLDKTKTSNDNLTLATLTYDDAGIDGDTLELSKWHHIVLHYDSIINLTEDQYIRVALMAANTGMTERVSDWKKLCINRGHIKNPIWEANPFDLASSYNVLVKSETCNITNGMANDTNDFWRTVPQGVYYFSAASMMNGQPVTYMIVCHIPFGNIVFQFGLEVDGNHLYARGSSTSGAMPAWKTFTRD